MLPLDRALLDRATALVDTLDGARVDRVDALTGLDTASLLTTIRTAGDMARMVDSLGAILCGEVTRRTQTDAGFRREVLGGDVGGRFAGDLLRETFRVADDTLRDWERVAEAIEPRTTLQGEPLPCRHEALVDAVLGAEVTARSAALIARGIDAVADHASPDDVAAAESLLLEHSNALTTRQLARACRAVADRFDPDGAEPREETLRARSSLTLRQLPNGLTRLIADLHPEAAGFVRTALDAQTAPRRQVAFTDAAADVSAGAADSAAGADAAGAVDAVGAAGAPLPDSAIDDRRTLAQKRVDALTTMARDFLAHDRGTLAGTAVTMLVTVPLETLQSGIGTATIAGVDEPISASTARRLAADAEIIPAVMGGESQVLDLGRCERLFSEAQRRALSLIDGGRVGPGCDVPPAWCEVAHILAWILGGETDLENGALMCPCHHRRFDLDGWGLSREGGVPYLIPPPWLDPAQTPLRAGRMPLAA
ncbi:HNH endonuclease signature motif containing protein [Protaetiibacter mangrovi]|uniref:HNH endonuclease n=1 Tax=Protaetiibacter mangrovi TaxID=2970926 RepID=A0ABT1ZEP1_9MICO|nr:HNH endonuclease signature motif containing protein [Protaetiibacter mangrovi]MCS0499179.1 HNH endonuclease [Protaetiibacter mangrovi]